MARNILERVVTTVGARTAFHRGRYRALAAAAVPRPELTSDQEGPQLIRRFHV
ncbi:MAG: hypothetical protein R6U89_10920 [Dehalococcoidia bacterium]